MVGFVAALTAGGSDTVASEIGKAFGRHTWMVHTSRAVPPGTPGAISLEGTAAGLVGALALGARRRRARPGAAPALAADCRRRHGRRLRGERARRHAGAPRHPEQRRAQLPEHRDRRGDAPISLASRGEARRARLYLELSRPFTLVAPALGVVSGAVTAAGAAPREPWSAALVIYPPSVR